MQDVAERKAALSLVAQRVGVMPWDKFDAVDAAVAALRKDAADLYGACSSLVAPLFTAPSLEILVPTIGPDGAVASLVPSAARWPALNKAWRDLTAAEPVFAGRKLDGGRSDFILACQDVAAYCKKLADDLECRVHAGIDLVAKRARICFRHSTLVSADIGEDERDALVELSNFLREHIELPSVLALAMQYQRLRTQLAEFGEGRGDSVSTVRSIFTREEISKGCQDVVYMLEVAAMRSQVESVVESMGSVVKQHNYMGLKGREWIEKEVFLAWGTPPAYTEAGEKFILSALKGDAHFVRNSPGRKVAAWDLSKVVDRLAETNRFNIIHTEAAADAADAASGSQE